MTTETTTTITTTTATTATTMTVTTATTMTSTTTMTTVTFTPSGIWALTIPTCATWNQTGITVAGNENGTYGSDLTSLYGPVSIFVDNNYTLYVADRDNNRIMKYYTNTRTGIVVAGNLTAGSSSTQLNSPKGVAVDQYGSVIVADSSNYRIQQFVSGSMIGTTVASNSSVNPLGQVRDLHIDVNNNIYVTDSDNSQVVKFFPYNGIGVVLAPTNGIGSGANQLSTPYGNFMDGNGTLYIADSGNSRVQMWSAGATTGITVAGITGSAGSNSSQLRNPYSIIVDNNGYIYVADGGNSRIMKWTTNYNAGGICVVGCTGTAGSAANQLRGPRDLKFDASGNLYVSDQGNQRIQKFMIQLSTTNCTISNREIPMVENL
ncbi:unnamed protein product [Rotaria sordida]|uniref:NHL repeat containing protein n=1 Tax=Rotaria sordida TaxID=392033 RepID=A0A818Z5S5_9BILA|nr:unnamed protein product [Rotaria sordida]